MLIAQTLEPGTRSFAVIVCVRLSSPIPHAFLLNPFLDQIKHLSPKPPNPKALNSKLPVICFWLLSQSALRGSGGTMCLQVGIRLQLHRAVSLNRKRTGLGFRALLLETRSLGL